MLPGFMLPSTGAFTIDGTIILTIGVIAVVGTLYKYRNNISFTNQDILVNEEENTAGNIKYKRNEEKTNNLEVKDAEEVEENIVADEEKVKLFN